MRRWLPWVAMAVVLAVSLAVGVSAGTGPRTPEERVASIARDVKCPTCSGLSAAESDAAAAKAVRQEIRTRVEAGQSESEIKLFLASRYGDDILLRPEAGGVAGLVWVLPVAVLVAALAGLAVAFRRWARLGATGGPTGADRRMVDDALGGEA